MPETRPGIRCPTGEARITPGFALPAKWVIHTVGPVYQGPDSAPLLANAYRSSLAVANDQSGFARSLAAKTAGHVVEFGKHGHTILRVVTPCAN